MSTTSSSVTPYYYKNQKGVVIVGTLQEFILKILTGDERLAPGGTWQILENGKKKDISEPSEIIRARNHANKHGTYKQPDWRPGCGWIERV